MTDSETEVSIIRTRLPQTETHLPKTLWSIKSVERHMLKDILLKPWVQLSWMSQTRTTKNVKGESVSFGFGPTFSVNNVSGSPTIGFDNTNTLSLRSQRIGSARTDLVGDEIV